MLLMLLITGCASTQTQVVRDIEYVEDFIKIPEYVYPPKYLLAKLQQCSDEDIPILSNDSIWGDLAEYSLLVQYKLLMCKAAADGILRWVKETKQIESKQ